MTNANGSGVITPIYSFAYATNGVNPYGGLIEGSDGALYGTTAYGGQNYGGSVFRLNTNGVLTTLAFFDGQNGSTPFSGLIRDANGSLYGTTSDGGAHGYGTV